MNDEGKCINTNCDEYLATYDNNCSMHIEGAARENCTKFIEAPRPQDSSGSTVTTGCKAIPAPSHIILYHGTNHVEHFWAEEVAKARYDIVKGDWNCNIYVKQ